MQTLWNWVYPDKRPHRAMKEDEPKGDLTPMEREELKQLRLQVARLEEEREILKRTTAFFAKESR